MDASSARDMAVARDPEKARIKPYISAEGPPLTRPP